MFFFFLMSIFRCSFFIGIPVLLNVRSCCKDYCCVPFSGGGKGLVGCACELFINKPHYSFTEVECVAPSKAQQADSCKIMAQPSWRSTLKLLTVNPDVWCEYIMLYRYGSILRYLYCTHLTRHRNTFPFTTINICTSLYLRVAPPCSVQYRPSLPR